MNPSELKKNRQYYYTAGAEWVKVTYKHKTTLGYMFKSNGVENVLTKESIELYIEKI